MDTNFWMKIKMIVFRRDSVEINTQNMRNMHMFVV